MTDSQSTPSNAAESSAVQTSVGALLRQSRAGTGLDIADVARVLRISQKYLEALEEGRHEDLPGTAYAIGFVRSYAEHLHLDSEEIVRRYKDEAAGVGTKNDLVFPKPIADGGVPGGAVLGLGVMVAAVAYGVWYWNSSNTEMEIARVEVVPEHMAAGEQSADTPTPQVAQTDVVANPQVVGNTPSEQVPSEPASVEPAPVEVAVVDETPVDTVMSDEAPVVNEATAQSAAETVRQVAESAEQTPEPAAQLPAEPAVVQAVEQTVEDAVAEATPEPAADVGASQVVASVGVEETASQAVENETQQDAVSTDAAPAVETANASPAAIMERQNDGPSRITVRAKSNSWIQIRDEIADRLLFTRLLREGQEYQVPNRDGLRLMTGNAGALELLVDGAAVPAIGDVGEVRRNVELDVDKLQSGSAVSE